MLKKHGARIMNDVRGLRAVGLTFQGARCFGAVPRVLPGVARVLP